MATIYIKYVSYRELPYTIEVEADVETDPELMHEVTVKNETDDIVWTFKTFDHQVEMSVDAAEKFIYRDVDKRLDAGDYMLFRMQNLGFR